MPPVLKKNQGSRVNGQFHPLKFAHHLCTYVAQPDCIKTKWKLSWQVIIKGSQNH